MVNEPTAKYLIDQFALAGFSWAYSIHSDTEFRNMPLSVYNKAQNFSALFYCGKGTIAHDLFPPNDSRASARRQGSTKRFSLALK